VVLLQHLPDQPGLMRLERHIYHLREDTTCENVSAGIRRPPIKTSGAMWGELVALASPTQLPAPTS
jgi:hypothetical protein